MSEKTNKIEYITFMQVVAAFSVVFLHTNNCFWDYNGSARYWITANFIECFFYFAVPIFFMITGITLLDFWEKYSLKDYFVKRVTKTVIPFLVWSLIGMVYYMYRPGVYSIEGKSLRIILEDIVNSRIVGVYWFFPQLFIIYLSIPLIAAVAKERRKEVFKYLIIAYIIFNSVIPFLAQVKLGISVSFYIMTVAGYLIWPILGYYLHYYSVNKKTKIVLIILSVFGFAVHFGGTWYLSVKIGSLDRVLKGYNAPPGLFYSIGVFFALKWIGTWIMKTKMKGFITFLGKYTFPIYLIHWYLYDIMIYYLKIDNKSIFFRLLSPFVIVLICIGITWILRKIPIIKRIVP